MALRRPKVDPAEAAKLDAIRRARPPKTDVTGTNIVALIELAKRASVDHVALIERWDESASIYEYDAGMTRAAAEGRALDDVRARYEPQKGLL